MRLKFVIVFFAVSYAAQSQVGGESVYQFLNLITSPRQAALGGKIITLHDYDVNQAFTNPAVINTDMNKQLGLSFANHLSEVKYGNVAYAYTWDRHVQTFFAGVTYANYGTFDGYDLDGNSTGEFSGNDMALTLGYAYNIPWTNLHVGTNLKLISSKLEQYSSLGVAADLGLYYQFKKNDIQIAAVVRNFGAQITAYDQIKEKLPLEVDFGISQSLEHLPLRWHLTFENLQEWDISFSNPAESQIDLEGNTTEEKVGFLSNVIRHTIIGVELFPEKGFNIRLGYNFRRAAELNITEQRSFSGISAGVGIKLKKLRLSFTHSRYSSAANTNLFGLHINLNK